MNLQAHLNLVGKFNIDRDEKNAIKTATMTGAHFELFPHFSPHTHPFETEAFVKQSLANTFAFDQVINQSI